MRCVIIGLVNLICRIQMQCPMGQSALCDIDSRLDEYSV